jgi:dihydropyrimidine dehydrogenase (NAD+) subunit PreA
MPSLEVAFGGLRLRNPVVIASAPPTETVENIARCADAGAAAVVTKTLADFDEARFPLGARRAHFDRSGMWALSTFRRETLTKDAGVRLIAQAVRRVDIPVIASVGALTMDPEDWSASCLAAQEAGAAMIQLDLFYAPQPRSSPDNIKRLLELFDVLAQRLDVPIAPKLNIDLPAHHIAQVLQDSPVSALLAMDSLRSPVPLDLRRGGHPLTDKAPNAPETSLFGAWQKPVTLQYARTLAENCPFDLCVGGGLMNGYDAAEAIMLGAACVQYATAVIKFGFKRVPRILDQLTDFMTAQGYATIADLRGAALDRFASREQDIVFTDVKAVVDHDLCTMCGICTSLVFCPDITEAAGRISISDHCDGCGLCVSACPTKPVALRLVERGAVGGPGAGAVGGR